MSTTPPSPTPSPSPHAAHAAHAAAVHAEKVAEAGRAGALLGYLIRGRRRPGEVTVISHSDLFYWWPVWLICFIMFAITILHGVHAGFINGNPHVVEIDKTQKFKVLDESKGTEEKWIEPGSGKAIITDAKDNPFPWTMHGGEEKHTWPMMHNSKNLGVIFAIILLVVVSITNIHLRGLWSLIIIIIIVLGSIIFALAGWWEEILSRGRLLAIHINAGAYLFMGLTLFVIWVLTFAFFDRQRYVAVTARQVRLKLAIGEGEIVYDATGLVFQKQRSDLFRHWILGFGSGDLIIRPGGGKDPIDLPNVLFVGSKVKEIEELIRAQQVTRAT